MAHALLIFHTMTLFSVHFSFDRFSVNIGANLLAAFFEFFFSKTILVLICILYKRHLKINKFKNKTKALNACNFLCQNKDHCVICIVNDPML